MAIGTSVFNDFLSVLNFIVKSVFDCHLSIVIFKNYNEHLTFRSEINMSYPVR